MKLVTINGYYKDNHERFCNLAVVWDKEDARNLEQVEGLDSQVMYEFDSMNELQHGDHPDFVITSFEL